MSKDLEIIGLKKRVRNLRILVVAIIAISSSFLVLDFYASLELKCDYDKKVAQLQKENEQLNEAVQYVYQDELFYMEANEQLIAHCKPCDVNKAIKATALPPLGKKYAHEVLKDK